MAHAAPPRWFCHACEGYFRQPADPHEPQCQRCHSSFVEELSPAHPHAPRNPYSNHFIDSFQDSDSPPIPSTRQRYEQQQNPDLHPHQATRQPFHQAAPFINLIDPLINILSAPSIPDPADREQPPHPTPESRLGSHARSSIGSFLTQHYSPRAFASPTPPPNRPAQTNEGTNNGGNRPNSSTSPRPPDQGVYTFTLGSGPSNRNPNDPNEAPHRPANQRSSTEPSRPSAGERAPTEDGFSFGTPPTPPQQPLNGILSLLQSAFGLTPSNSAAPPSERQAAEESHSNNSPAPEEPTPNEPPSSPPSPSGLPEGDPAQGRSRENSHRPHPRPTPRSPRVNLEESHPLRQFIDILNSLNQSDASISQNAVNGFVINGEAAGFGFGTQFDMEHNSPFGQHLGDYVTSDSAMQDILNQLINMTGANGGHNPIPASESTIKSLRKFKFDSAPISQEDAIECAICKDTFAAGDSCMELPCKHFFHDEDCIVLWLQQNGSCPVCRYSLVNDQNTNNQAGEGEGENRDVPQSSTAANDSQSRPDSADWLDPDRWYDEEQLEAPFDYD